MFDKMFVNEIQVKRDLDDYDGGGDMYASNHFNKIANILDYSKSTANIRLNYNDNQQFFDTKDMGSTELYNAFRVTPIKHEVQSADSSGVHEPGPPKKLIKTESPIAEHMDARRNRILEICNLIATINSNNIALKNTKTTADNIENNDNKSVDSSVDCGFSSDISTDSVFDEQYLAKRFNKNVSFDMVLQEIFSWNPQWLQGEALIKPPTRKFSQHMQHWPYKLDYENRDEYLCRHFPYIYSQLFISLSEVFKNDAPSRVRHRLYVKDSENCGKHELNKRLDCYVLRDIERHPKPMGRPYDVVILWLDVMKMSTKNVSNKVYFGQIASHSLIDIHQLDAQIVSTLDTHVSVDDICKGDLLCDRFTIFTKRSLESSIVTKRIAIAEVVLNGAVMLRQMENLLIMERKCRKLLHNIYTGSAIVHRYVDNGSVNSQTEFTENAVKEAIKMIARSSLDVILLKDSSPRLMVVDITDNEERMEWLCDLLVDGIRHSNINSEKLRFLMITESVAKCQALRERLNRVCGGRRLNVKAWALDGGLGWTRHAEVRRTARVSARQVAVSCGHKLDSMVNTMSTAYKELFHKRFIYQKVVDSCQYPVYKPVDICNLLPAVHIVREELFSKGFESLLSTHNVILGTFETVLNCPQLLSQPIDCCIIDGSHGLSDPHVLSILHTGIRCLILTGSIYRTTIPVPTKTLTNPVVIDNGFDISLFHRCLQKHIESQATTE